MFFLLKMFSYHLFWRLRWEYKFQSERLNVIQSLVASGRMLVKVVFLTLLVLSASPNGAEGSFIGDIFNAICNVCLTSLNTVDDVINSEGLKKVSWESEGGRYIQG